MGRVFQQQALGFQIWIHLENNETNALKCIGSGAKKHFEKAKALIGVVDKPGYKSSSVIGGEIISPQG